MYMKKYFIALLSFVFATTNVFGNDLDDGKLPYEVPVVSNIKYIYEGGNLRINQEAIESHVQLEKGKEFKQYLADSSIKSLYNTGLFDYVRVRLDQVSDGKYDVTFILTQKLSVKNLNISGNKKVKSKVIRREITTSSGGVYSENVLHMDVQKLGELYQKKGFPYAKISYSVEELEDGSGINVNLVIDEGPKMHVGKIKFKGIDDIKSKKLKKVIQTKTWTLLSWLNGTGTFNKDILNDDINRLKVFIKDHGYLDVAIDEKDVEFSTSKHSINLTFNISKGKLYNFGEINITGNEIYPADRLFRLVKINNGERFSPTKINNACENIRDFYGQAGYLDTEVHVDRIPNVNTGNIDVIFRITENEKCYLHSINIKGNSKTKNNVILRELSLAPGDIFDTVSMKNNQMRLQNTRFFQAVDLSPSDTDIPNEKNLRVEVKEANTGKFSVGGGVSSGSEVVGFIEFSQTNFDWHGGKSKFQGGGQKFRTRFQVGRRSNSFDINFEEPWWYDRELALGVNLFRSQQEYKKHNNNNYDGSNYDEVRTGGEIYLRKRLFGLWVGTVTYHAEDVNIYHMEANAPKSFRDEVGHRFISKGMFLLERDTRDNLLYPTCGSVISIATDVAGGPFFGETKYIKLNALGAKFIPTFEPFDQNIMFMGKIGTMCSYGHDNVPFFDKFFLGGSNYMKGFKTHDVGPSENGTGIGGQTYAYGTAEYTFRIADPFRLYFFSEVGFVNESHWNFNTKRYCTDAGFGMKIFIMGAPLRLDFGFPIHGQENNKHGMRFNYSFGMAF